MRKLVGIAIQVDCCKLPYAWVRFAIVYKRKLFIKFHYYSERLFYLL